MKSLLPFLVLVILFHGFSDWLCAAPGSIDPAFGDSGILITSFADSAHDVARCVAVQGDGKVIVAGFSVISGNHHWRVARYTHTGTLDPSFGNSGSVTTWFGGDSDEAQGIAIQNDGKIVVVGWATGQNSGFAVARFDATGSLDSSFGSGGKVSIPDNIPSPSPYAQRVLVQSDGKIVVMGENIYQSPSVTKLMRLTSSGGLDANFGAGGFTSINNGTHALRGWALAQQSDGKYLVAGQSQNGSRSDFALVRVNTNGSLDSSFGTGGIVTTAINSGAQDSNYLHGLAVQSDGKIVTTGETQASGVSAGLAVLRFNIDGSLDQNFGSGGKVNAVFAGNQLVGYDVFIQSDGRILITGGKGGDFALTRFSDSGSLDLGFGEEGLTTTDFGWGYASVGGGAMQEDGSVVIAGGVYDGYVNSFALARYATVSVAVPTVQTLAPDQITGTSVTLHGIVNANGADTAAAFGYGWGLNSYTYTLLASPRFVFGTVGTAISATITDLTPGTTYSFRADGANSGGTTHGNFVVFTTLSDDANLSNLSLSSGSISPFFVWAYQDYTANVPFTTSSISITPTSEESHATITVNGKPVASGSASAAIALSVGPNTISTIVTAQDGVTTKTYTVVVTRAPVSTNADLSALATSRGPVSPVFASATTSYALAVPYTATSFTVTPTVADSHATVTVNGSPVASGTASAAIPLNVGANNVSVSVTAQDGVTIKSYTVVVTRAPVSTNASLSNLLLSSGTLSPTFSSGIASYTASVSSPTSSINVTPTLADSTATVNVNGVTVTSGSASGAIPINVGNNTITIATTAQDGVTTQSYTVVVMRAPSTNANLNSLVLSSGTLSPAFASGTTSYTASVSNATASITVTATLADSTATVKVNAVAVTSGTASGTIPLNVGSNTLSIATTAQDGVTTQTYTVVVTRAPSANANLSSLILSSGTLSPGFFPSTVSYTATVSNATTSITVTPTLADSTATITVNGQAVASGSASPALPLSLGSNTITITVTDENGVTLKTYTVAVTRPASTNANLSSLVLSSGTLSPTFSSGTINYSADVASSVSSITVTPASADSGATIRVNGVLVTSGTASGSVALNAGSNTITVVVTAQNGSTTKTYSVVVTRQQSSNAWLSNLTLSSGTLNPAFSSTTTNYTALVPYSTASITTTATLADSTAALVINNATATSGLASDPVTLNVGANPVGISVTAEDGFTQHLYTVTVIRSPQGAPAAGDLDPAFNNGGVTFASPGPMGGDARAMALQADGRIIIAGSASGAADSDFVLMSCLSTGGLDPSFGNGGKVVTDFSGRDDYASSVAVQSDGKIIVAGYSYGTSDSDIALVRYQSTGELDSSFGIGGKVLADFGAGEYVAALAVQSDGKIIVAGYSSPDIFDVELMVVRYLSTGELDTSFGSGGEVITSVGGYLFDTASALVVQADGKIVVTGAARTSSTQTGMAVVRYTPSGELDTTFGNGGKVITNLGQNNNNGSGLVVQPDGKIVVGGYSGARGDGGDFGLVRYTPSGALDSSFGTAGVAVADFGGNEYGAGLAIQADGKLVLCGYTGDVFAQRYFVTTRFTSSGAIDGSFGNGGLRVTALGVVSDDARAVVVQTDGKIVVGGNSNGDAGNVFVLARYLTPSGASVQTVAASSITSTGVTLNGVVNANGGSVSASFDYGLTATYGSSVAANPVVVSGSGATAITATLNGLSPNTTYHFRASGGSTFGSDFTFTTRSAVQDWRQLHFGTAANTGTASDSADADGDGVSNLMEFATASNPNVSSPLAPSASRTGNNMTFTYPRSKAALADGLSFTVEWSDTLQPGSWSTSGVSEVVLSDDGTVQQVKATLPAGTNGHRFVHLSVSPP